MKFIIDNALSPKLSTSLQELGYDAVHVRDYGMKNESDEMIFDRACNENRIILTTDMDFGKITAKRKSQLTSVILFRKLPFYSYQKLLELLILNFPTIQEPLEKVSIVVIEERRIRIREYK